MDIDKLYEEWLSSTVYGNKFLSEEEIKELLQLDKEMEINQDGI